MSEPGKSAKFVAHGVADVVTVGADGADGAEVVEPKKENNILNTFYTIYKNIFQMMKKLNLKIKRKINTFNTIYKIYYKNWNILYVDSIKYVNICK